jgi:hypothetical protein
VTFGERFADTGIKGALLRAAVAWLLITPAVVAAKILWSKSAAIVVFVVCVLLYVAFAVRFTRRSRPPPD